MVKRYWNWWCIDRKKKNKWSINFLGNSPLGIQHTIFQWVFYWLKELWNFFLICYKAVPMNSFYVHYIFISWDLHLPNQLFCQKLVAYQKVSRQMKKFGELALTSLDRHLVIMTLLVVQLYTYLYLDFKILNKNKMKVSLSILLCIVKLDHLYQSGWLNQIFIFLFYCIKEISQWKFPGQRLISLWFLSLENQTFKKMCCSNQLVKHPKCYLWSFKHTKCSLLINQTCFLFLDQRINWSLTVVTECGPESNGNEGVT